MMNKWVISLFFLCATAYSRLPLPSTLIALDTEYGQTLLNSAEYRNDMWPLSQYFITQRGLMFCGIASAVMALNALQLPMPISPDYAPYRLFTQDNIFDAKVSKILTPTSVQHRGVTLAQLAAVMQAHGAKTRITYAHSLSEATLENTIIEDVQARNRILIVNFSRTALQQRGGGHFSPVAAYHHKQKKVLLLDVARYKYASFWVSLPQLLHAMISRDDPVSGMPRGLLSTYTQDIKEKASTS